MTATSAYIHIPFCSHICYYCDFAKALLDGQPVDEYLNALRAEYESYQIKKLRTLYIGGGTPTVLTVAQMKRLLTGLSASEEFTVEANPGDLSPEMIHCLADSAVNRISLGVQTFDDDLLRRIGRSHTEADVYQSIQKLRDAGFQNLSIDLIYGLPGQKLDDVKRDVRKFLELDLPHIALYSLILEDHTVFMNRQRRGTLKLPSDDRNAEMYEWIMAELTDQSYRHYEISNFAKPGYESKHNLVYWDNAEYYGIGAGASGYLDGIRYKNHGPIHHYLEAVNKRVSEEKLSRKSMMEEEMFLGLRKAEGVSIPNFEKKFSANFQEIYSQKLNELFEFKLIKQESGRISLTEKGFELGNEVFEKFLLD